MLTGIEHIKGMHPGLFIERELKKRNLPKSRFAISIHEYPQTLVAITKCKRKLTPSLALRIEKELGLEEGYLLILQAYYEIEVEKRKLFEEYHPDLTKIRSVIFWDTDINKIDWKKNKTAVIKRVLERGNDDELKEIISFYGKESILLVVNNFGDISPLAKENINKRLLLLL